MIAPNSELALTTIDDVKTHSAGAPRMDTHRPARTTTLSPHTVSPLDALLSKDELAFRDEMAEFVAHALPAALADKVRRGLRLEKEDYLTWQRALHAHGLAAPGWPVVFGGTGWSATKQHLFEEVCAEAGAPVLMPFGLRMIAPVLMQFGDAAQQTRFLPGILSGDDWWCQGYSEPGAGSDLASLKTRAVRHGDHYIVNGQKTWTTLGQFANWMFCLVRTDSTVKPQAGISFLLIDMHQPGVTVRPIRLVDGDDQEVNEVYLDDVVVPVENRIGEENGGWTYAKFLLGHERTGIAGVGASKGALRRLKETSALAQQGGRSLLDDPRFRDRIARLEIELMALELTLLRALKGTPSGAADNVAASILKIKGSEIQQQLAELQMTAGGAHALPWIAGAEHAGWTPDALVADWAPVAGTATGRYFNMRKTTIYGGSSEIQKNIIARALLGAL